MDRRTFLERLFPGATLAGLLLIVGCGRQERAAGFGNEEKLWDVTNGNVESQEPIALDYAKNTPALYRDASMAKPDPSFVPKVSGG